MTPVEQLMFERLVKVETEMLTLKDNYKDLKLDIKELEETIKNNHNEIQKSIKENNADTQKLIKELQESFVSSKEALIMGKGIGKFVGWLVAGVTLIVAIFKYLKP